MAPFNPWHWQRFHLRSARTREINRPDRESMPERVLDSRRTECPSPLSFSALLIISNCFTLSQAAVPRIRGVQPSLAEKYSAANGAFSCLDGSRQLPFAKVNDDFCDCIDGSDEPGTSACPQGKFYCRNRGHNPRLLNASYVDDQICDCCDGSDEQPGLCGNNCASAGAAHRASLKARSVAFRQGLNAKERYIKNAVSTRKGWKADVRRLKEEEAVLKARVSELQARREGVERVEAREREEQAAKQRAEEAAKPKEEPIEDPAEAPLTEGQQASEGTSSGASEGADSNQKTEEQLEEELSEEEKGRRIAAQWTRDPEAVGETAPEAADEDLATSAGNDDVEIPHVPKYEVPSELAETSPEGQAIEEAKAELQSGIAGTAKRWLYGIIGWAADGDDLDAAARQKIKDDYQAEQTKLTEAERRLAELTQKLDMDSGPDREFLGLVDRCFTASVEKYVYEVCPFRSAAQKDGAMTTSLGSWDGYMGNHTGLAFRNGLHCWNGPNRSLQVDLVCGPKEELYDVEEPSRCEYRAKLTTPAACSAREAEAVEAELTALEEELARKDEL